MCAADGITHIQKKHGVQSNGSSLKDGTVVIVLFFMVFCWFLESSDFTLYSI